MISKQTLLDTLDIFKDKLTTMIYKKLSSKYIGSINALEALIIPDNVGKSYPIIIEGGLASTLTGGLFTTMMSGNISILTNTIADFILCADTGKSIVTIRYTLGSGVTGKYRYVGTSF